MARHNSALELAYAIQINLAQSEEERKKAKRDSMARWRKKKAGGRYPTKTTPEASAEAAKLRSTPSPEGRRKAQSLEMAHVDKARDWPQCDQCNAPRAADDGKGEPVVDHGNYLCRRCASKVGKAYFIEDPITESVLRKQSTMPQYTTAGASGVGEEGNEDDGNYSNPDERPLYQRTGAWPDELWTNTDPKDRGKQGQEAIDDSERYYLNKAEPTRDEADAYGRVADAHTEIEDIYRNAEALGLDSETYKIINQVHELLEQALDSPGFRQHDQQRQLNHSHDTRYEDNCDNADLKRPGVVYDRQGAPVDQLRKMNDWYANGGQIDAADYQELTEPEGQTAINLSFLGPIMKGMEMIDAGDIEPGAETLAAPTGMHHMETADGEREGHLVIDQEDELSITDGKKVFELPEQGVTININVRKAVALAERAVANLR